MDRITYEMLKHVPRQAKSELIKELERQFNENVVKHSWRQIKIVPIPKANKNLEEYKNFRPISLISTIVKILNMLVKENLMNFIDTKKLLPSRSFAYRKKKSTTMCINEVLFTTNLLKNQRKKFFYAFWTSRTHTTE